ncbi:hypothetical protein [Phascolarctobacterium succinatutens]|uniref:hypothetical protein n=1 Tax=Phascolarctobacterium succinatutens TaxID=626940 RepID=UPI00307F9794
MKKIDIKAFGEGQQIWFNIGRLRRVEDMLKCPIGEVLQDADKLSLKNLLVLLSVGMSQNGNKTEQYYAEKIDEAMENGYSIADIQLPVVKAVAASSILGVGAYYQLFPDELTDEQKADIEYEKN